MTERLYYTDAYLRAFDAEVVAIAEEGRRVYLDRTAFYPTSGGQPFDTGRIGDVAVVEVVDEGERIAHLLERPLVAGPVAGRIDWPRRFDHMQQHTGQHLLSAVFAELFGYDTASVHFGAEVSTLDLDAAAPAPEQIAAAELRANAVVTENRPVEVTFENAAAARALRKTPERSGEIRVVTIRDLDRSACGGTHVRATGEIGAILIRRVERVRKTVRVEFLCGGRAVRRARRDFDLLTRLAAPLSAAPEELPALVERMRGELKDAGAARRALIEELGGYRARALYESTVPDAAGVRRAAWQTGQGSLDELRCLAQAFAALPGAVLAGAILEPPTVVLAASEDSGVDAGKVLKAALGGAGGRGGGSARIAQGTVPDAGALMELVRRLTA